MPVSYSFAGRLFRLDLVGSYSIDEIEESFDRALADEAFPEDAVFLADVRRSGALATRDAHDINTVADRLGPRLERSVSRCAMVAEEPVHFGLMRMATVFLETHGVQAMVFDDLFAAVEWLGLPPESEPAN
jgi:hypothetical protein